MGCCYPFHAQLFFSLSVIVHSERLKKEKHIVIYFFLFCIYVRNIFLVSSALHWCVLDGMCIVQKSKLFSGDYLQKNVSVTVYKSTFNKMKIRNMYIHQDKMQYYHTE